MKYEKIVIYFINVVLVCCTLMIEKVVAIPVIKQLSWVDDSTIRTDSTRFIKIGLVDGRRFIARVNTEGILTVKDAKGNLIFKEVNEEVADAFFEDLNKDGYKDIKITYFTNVPGIENVLLYDKYKKSFKKVKGFDEYPDTHKVGTTLCYYSYHRSGCADMDWTSDLFYIKNFKCVRLGTIEGYECGDRDIKNGVYIYKIVNGKKAKIRQLNIKSIYYYKDYKWGFIEAY